MITKKGTCAPMTIRSQLDKNSEFLLYNEKYLIVFGPQLGGYAV